MTFSFTADPAGKGKWPLVLQLTLLVKVKVFNSKIGWTLNFPNVEEPQYLEK